jgi:hypothetical protein
MTFTSGVSEVFGDISNANFLPTPGRIVVSGGAQANFYDDVTNAGSIQVSAAGTLQSSAVFLGSLSGNGVAGGGHVFSEGDMRPGFSPGTMAFGGDLSFGPLANLEIELAGVSPGTQFDRVTVAESLALGGTLDVSLLGGFTPAPGNAFEIITAANSISGTFDNVVLPGLSDSSWHLDYNPNSVVLQVGLLGDYNLNGAVDAGDYVIWRKTLGQFGFGLAADGNSNNQIDAGDFDIWRANFGNMAGSGAGSGAASTSQPAVPEPGSLALILLGLIGILLVPDTRRSLA